MKYISVLFCVFILTPLSSFAFEIKNIETLAKNLNLYGGEKATVQWRRVFSSQRHLQRYRLDVLDQETRNQLEEYLIKHAADSEQPIVPGIL
ncbi:MAG: hypothetical protein IE887_03735 [Campylobacterales bacterium]|nr:hypothetical protein [Campylobacterales bacterium]